MSDCVFCEIVAGRAPSTVLAEWSDAMAIEPLNPVTLGHTLIIPRAHVADAGVDPLITAVAFGRAAQYASRLKAYNLITSKGADATQTVLHLHVHVVPRNAYDGLNLPWPERS